MRICKLFLLLLLFLFVFTACQSAEQPTPIPETPESIVEEPEPVPEEPAPIVEEPEPILLPDPAAIEAKTQQASIWMVSFSLRMGSAPSSSSLFSVLLKLVCRFSQAMSSPVISSWATV